MSEPKFGTDGIRGVANSELTPEIALKLGIAAGRWLVNSGGPRRVVFGMDTRQSGPMLGDALSAGFNSAGVAVSCLGIAPTPTVAFVTRKFGYGLGAVISASHNPAPDNGIKLFGPDGAKLTDSAEAGIEAGLHTPFTDRPTGGGVGGAEFDEKGHGAYIDYLLEVLQEGLQGMKIALDCAHGAAYTLGPEILDRLGANVVAKGIEPDGTNINAECGATKPESICKFTVEQGAGPGWSAASTAMLIASSSAIPTESWSTETWRWESGLPTTRFRAS